MVNIGDIPITNIKLGDIDIVAGFLGDIPFYTSTPLDWLYFKNYSSAPQTLVIWSDNVGDAPADYQSIQYSLDTIQWQNVPIIDDSNFLEMAVQGVNPGESIYLRGNNPFMTTGTNHTVIFMTGDYAIGGNIATLFWGTDYHGETFINDDLPYGFAGLFRYPQNVPYNIGWLMNAEELTIPQANKFGAFAELFADQTQFNISPKITQNPSPNGYERMFWNCQSLAKIYALFTDCGQGFTDDWVMGVSGYGNMFVTDINLWQYGDSGCPNGWNIMTI